MAAVNSATRSGSIRYSIITSTGPWSRSGSLAGAMGAGHWREGARFSPSPERRWMRKVASSPSTRPMAENSSERETPACSATAPQRALPPARPPKMKSM